MACGTGACASLVAAHLAGLVDAHTLVRFPGGVLDIDWRRGEGDRVLMTGGVERTFEGVLDADWLRSRVDGTTA
jgi:diaminopimelate epimerase